MRHANTLRHHFKSATSRLIGSVYILFPNLSFVALTTGCDVVKILLVAHVVSVRTSPSSTVYELEDGTSRGRISARRWSSEADCDELPDDCSKLYVDIVGHLDRKVRLNARNCVIIEHIHAATDVPNRLFFHILDTAFVTLSLQRGPPVRSLLCIEALW